MRKPERSVQPNSVTVGDASQAFILSGDPKSAIFHFICSKQLSEVAASGEGPSTI